MAVFPLRKRPAVDYHQAPLCFGSNRDGGKRKHAGVDLYAPVGTEILSIDDGVVIQPAYLFYAGTLALEVKHTFGIVRYGEIASPIGPLKTGDRVNAGQPIALVGRLHGMTISMLHLELFSGTAAGQLTDRDRLPYMRRSDLIDPTTLLDSLPLLEG